MVYHFWGRGVLLHDDLLPLWWLDSWRDQSILIRMTALKRSLTRPLHWKAGMRDRWVHSDLGWRLHDLVPLNEDHLVWPWKTLIAGGLTHFNDCPPLLNLDVITHFRIVDPLMVKVTLYQSWVLFWTGLASLWTTNLNAWIYTQHWSHIDILVGLFRFFVYNHGLLRGWRRWLGWCLIRDHVQRLWIGLLYLEHRFLCA